MQKWQTGKTEAKKLLASLTKERKEGSKKIRSTDHRRRRDVRGGKKEGRNARNVFHLSH
jgi:hypothetical protein